MLNEAIWRISAIVEERRQRLLNLFVLFFLLTSEFYLLLFSKENIKKHRFEKKDST